MADHDLAGLRCSDLLELAGSFVLGALTPEESDAVRRHLAACPEAHAEFAELGSVVPALFEVVEPVAPPPGLKDRVLAAAAAELRAAESQRAVDGPPALDPERTVKPFLTAESQRRGFDLGALFRRPIWAAVAAAAVVVAIALGAFSLQLQDRLDGLSAYRDGVNEVLEEANRPGAELALLTAPEGAAGPNGLAAVGADGSVAVVMRDLAPTSGNQVYETWLIGADGTPIPIGSFRVDDSRTASFTTAHATLGPGVTVALTLEPQAGATTPTMPIVALGTARGEAS